MRTKVTLCTETLSPATSWCREKSDDAETVKAVDFGIAPNSTGVDEFNPADSGLRQAKFSGSPLYMSPEQMHRCGRRPPKRSIFNGLLFMKHSPARHCLWESRHFRPRRNIKRDKAPSLKEASLGTSYPYVLEEIIGKLLEKDPNNRYQSAKAVAKRSDST